MYRELEAADHRRILGIEAHEVPDVLLLVGIFAVHAGAERFTAYLDEAVPLKRYPAWLGRGGGLRVAVAGCFGGPMAAMHAHTWCMAGTPAVIQLGWFGALQPGMAAGEVIVPGHAERQDGASDWYLPKGILADATPELAEAVAGRLRARGLGVREGAIYSTPALLAESREVIRDWSRHGYQGVDMETAATFAVAKSLGARRAAALIRLDDLVAEADSVAIEMTRERRRLLRDCEAQVTGAVLEAIADVAPAAPLAGAAAR
ncbi:MAG: hypothetical protein ACR2HN_02180 [Tepidiformaceae bacterium]